jgi:hypothetical protein
MIKLYTQHNGVARLKRERIALEMLADSGCGDVPRLVAVQSEPPAVVLSYVPGNAIHRIMRRDAAAAVAFLDRVRDCAPGAEIRNLPNAWEACFSGAEVETQIRSRLQRLQRVAITGSKLAAFLSERLTHRLARAATHAQNRMGASWNRDLCPTLRYPSPSDFGFHNALRRHGGLVFLDFEYFGWDDPVKLLCDMLWHPGMTLPRWARETFHDAAIRRADKDPGFADRFAALYPLYGLRWATILLNPFLPERETGNASLRSERLKKAEIWCAHSQFCFGNADGWRQPIGAT